MAKTVKPAKKTPVFKAEVVEDSEVKIELTESPIPGMEFRKNCKNEFIPEHKQVWIPPTPSDFLTSKGFSQVHQGQRISATFEEIHSLLKEYRAL